MSRIDSSLTVQQLVDHCLKKGGPIHACPFEENGVITGGIIFIDGEANFEMAKSLFGRSTQLPPTQI